MTLQDIFDDRMIGILLFSTFVVNLLFLLVTTLAGFTTRKGRNETRREVRLRLKSLQAMVFVLPLPAIVAYLLLTKFAGVDQVFAFILSIVLYIGIFSIVVGVTMVRPESRS